VTVTVGIRELRSNLRAYLQRIRAGDDVIVTDRGTPVARLTPVERGQTTLEQLIEEGLVTPARLPKTPIDLESLPRLRSGTLSDIVIEQRRSRPY
jgi:prevent-host-death family protein